METIDAIKARCAYFKELATLYYPLVTPKTAAQNLRNDIEQYGLLRKDLASCGWERSRRTLTPRQIDTILHYLGPPE